MRHHVAGDRDVVCERRRLPAQDVGAVVEKTLIVDEPASTTSIRPGERRAESAARDTEPGSRDRRRYASNASVPCSAGARRTRARRSRAK